jgi:hypothetical protein
MSPRLTWPQFIKKSATFFSLFFESCKFVSALPVASVCPDTSIFEPGNLRIAVISLFVSGKLIVLISASPGGK